MEEGVQLGVAGDISDKCIYIFNQLYWRHQNKYKEQYRNTRNIMSSPKYAESRRLLLV